MIPNLTPKQKFQQSDVRMSDHNRMIESEAFDRACDTALLEYSLILFKQQAERPEAGFNGAAASNLRLMGANEIIDTIRKLSVQPSKVITRDNINLNHHV
jgi:hypothetical protein